MAEKVWVLEVNCGGAGWHEEARFTDEEGGRGEAEAQARMWRDGGCETRIVEGGDTDG